MGVDTERVPDCTGAAAQNALAANDIVADPLMVAAVGELSRFTSSSTCNFVNPSLSSSPLSSSITPSLFHSRLKTYLFNKSFPP